MNTLIPDGGCYAIEHDGFDIEEIFHTLPSDVRKLIETTNILTMFEIQLVISDITETRQSSAFRGLQADKAPNRFIGYLTLVLLSICIYDIFVFVANYKNDHGKIEGVIYELIKWILSFFTAIISFL